MAEDVKECVEETMAGGQHEIFNFDTRDSDFEFGIWDRGSISLLTFTRKREGFPDDNVLMWVKTEWLDKIREQIDLRRRS